jgi:hypothetical protein
MNTYHKLTALALVALSAFACSSARDVEVNGEVSAASGSSVQGEIVVEFYDIAGEGEELELTNIHSLTLAEVGSFKETVPVEGDRLLIRAIADTDGDGACSANEAWAESEVAIDGDTATVSLALSAKACPTQ